MTAALLRRKRAVDNGTMFQIGLAGFIVGALTFTAPLVLLRGSSIRGMSLVFYSMVIPLPIIGGIVLALIGGMLANIFIRTEKAKDVKAISYPLLGLFQIELALTRGVLMALLMFSPILFAGGASSSAYHGVSDTVTKASFFIVSIGEAIIGALAVRYSHARSMRGGSRHRMHYRGDIHFYLIETWQKISCTSTPSSMTGLPPTCTHTAA